MFSTTDGGRLDRLNRPRGFSTLAMLVSLVLLGFLLAPLLGTVMSAQRGFVESRQRAHAAGSARYAHLALTRLLRAAGSSPMAGPVQGIDPDPDGNGDFDDVRLRSDFNPPDGDLNDPGEDLVFYLQADTLYARRGSSGSGEPYVIGVDSMAFEYFDRDGAPITDPDKVATHAITARVFIRARSEAGHDPSVRMLTGTVRLRNGR